MRKPATRCMCGLGTVEGRVWATKTVRRMCVWVGAMGLQVLASCSYDDSVRIWQEDNDDWYCAATLTGHTSTVWGIAFDPTGDRLGTHTAGHHQPVDIHLTLDLGGL